MKVITPKKKGSRNIYKRKKLNSRIKWKKSFKFFEKARNRYILYGLFFLIIFAFSINFLLQKTFLAQKYIVLYPSFTSESISKFDDPNLIRLIKTETIGKNYFIIKYIQKNEILNQMKNEFNIVKDWDLYLLDDNKIAINIIYQEPNLIFKDNLGYRGVYSNHFFEIFSGSTFLSGELLIELPDYTSKNRGMTGFFYEVSEEMLGFQISELVKLLGKENIGNIKYLPGGAKTIIDLKNGKKIYLCNTKKISDQIRKYIMLQQFYENFDKITEIDLGSIEEPIIKLKNIQ